MDTCEVFETKKANTFVFVRQEADLGRMPDALTKRLAPAQHFKTVDLDQCLLAADCNKTIIR